MYKRHLTFVFFFLLFNSIISPQNHSYENSAKIILAEVNFEGIVTRYKNGNTRVYPPSKVAYQARHYIITFKVKLNDVKFVLREQLKIKCFLSNGKVIERNLRSKQGVYFPEEIYESRDEIYTEESYFGQARVELVLYFPDVDNNKKNKEIVLDKTTIFIQ